MKNFTAAANVFARTQELFPDGKYLSLAKKWEREANIAISERIQMKNLQEDNQQNMIDNKSSSQDVIDFFEKDLPVESEKVIP